MVIIRGQNVLFLSCNVLLLHCCKPSAGQLPAIYDSPWTCNSLEHLQPRKCLPYTTWSNSNISITNVFNEWQNITLVQCLKRSISTLWNLPQTALTPVTYHDHEFNCKPTILTCIHDAYVETCTRGLKPTCYDVGVFVSVLEHSEATTHHLTMYGVAGQVKASNMSYLMGKPESGRLNAIQDDCAIYIYQNTT